MCQFNQLSALALSVAAASAQAVTLGVVPNWNLLGYSDSADVIAADAFGNANNVSTVWKWNPATSVWAFYSPTLPDGGKAYAASKGYEFLTTIKTGDGFWVNAKAPFSVTLPVTQQPLVTTGTAEGIWTGSTVSGAQVDLLILENGETWGIFGLAGSVVGALYGNTSSTSTSLSGSGSSFNFLARTSSTGSYTGGYTAKGSINVTVSDGNKFSGTYVPAYDQAATVAGLAGVYAGWAVTGSTVAQPTNVTIDGGGNISSSYVSGSLSCNTSGKVTPRASGKNVFNIQLTFSGNFCALGNGATVNGVGSYNSASKQIIAIGLNSAKSDGLFYLGKTQVVSGTVAD